MGRDGQTFECWLGSFVIFQGIRTSIAKKPYRFVIFQGGGGPESIPLSAPSGSVYANASGQIMQLMLVVKETSRKSLDAYNVSAAPSGTYYYQKTWRSNEIGKLWFRKVFCQTVANSGPSFWMDTVYMEVYVYLNWQKAKMFFLCHSLYLHPMPSSLLTKQYLGLLKKHTTRLVLSIALSIGGHSHIFQTGMEFGFDREEYYQHVAFIPWIQMQLFRTTSILQSQHIDLQQRLLGQL